MLDTRKALHSAAHKELLVAVAPHQGPISNLSRLAQYKSKRAIKVVNPNAKFPVAIYQ